MGIRGMLGAAGIGEGGRPADEVEGASVVVVATTGGDEEAGAHVPAVCLKLAGDDGLVRFRGRGAADGEPARQFDHVSKPGIQAARSGGGSSSVGSK